MAISLRQIRDRAWRRTPGRWTRTRPRRPLPGAGRQHVVSDITTGAPQGAERYGLVRDTGGDDTPVPQYVTRSTPADPATVPQRSRV
jgi:hypothetical protein